MQNPNWFLNNNTNNQLPNNGARFSAPQQVWPQFQVRTPPNNLQPFANPMANFSPSPFFQYPPPGGFHNLNANNYHVQNPLNLPQFMCNAQTQLQNANQMLQPQIASQGFVPLLHNQFSTGVFPQNLPNMLSNGPANPQLNHLVSVLCFPSSNGLFPLLHNNQFSTGVLQQNLPNMLSNGPANPQQILEETRDP
ncbi:hypothetical protein M569_17524 [Genlisea aurea]|uniref:Uncharacterized protein n=1 Tax=Genlisea aurea TaxID=192259 RepID=S8BRP6_9LAMI|nr:hypothetical protein M569_17524 [Genlisea aurea]